MIEKPKRPKKIPNQDNKQPQTIEQLIRRYDLDNTKIYDFLDELVSNINRKNTYSTEEQIIGTWVDGRKIYRKYIITKTPSVINTEEVIAILPENQLTMISMCVQVYSPKLNAIVPFPVAFNTEVMGGVFYNPSTKQFIAKVNNSAYTNIELTIITEYTKTTD